MCRVCGVWMADLRGRARARCETGRARETLERALCRARAAQDLDWVAWTIARGISRVPDSAQKCLVDIWLGFVAGGCINAPEILLGPRGQSGAHRREPRRRVTTRRARRERRAGLLVLRCDAPPGSFLDATGYEEGRAARRRCRQSRQGTRGVPWYVLEAREGKEEKERAQVWRGACAKKIYSGNSQAE